MVLDLARSKYMNDLAGILYSWLPGSNPPFSRQYTFGEAAVEFGLHWKGGSKLPAIQGLLEESGQRGVLPKVVFKIISEGLKYRTKGTNIVTRGELENINSLMEKLGYKIPELHDEMFLSSFSELDNKSISVDKVKLVSLGNEYKNMKTNPDIQARGYEFQTFLENLFKLWRLNPRSAFRTTGEEIDGSFELDNEIYLLEAKWRKKPAEKSDLVIFSSKIDSKSEWTRGIFISVNGYTDSALENFNKGRKLNMIAMSGNEIELVISGKEDLVNLLRKKVRKSAEEGKLYFQNNTST